jgi:hypothetical protein
LSPTGTDAELGEMVIVAAVPVLADSNTARIGKMMNGLHFINVSFFSHATSSSDFALFEFPGLSI